MKILTCLLDSLVGFRDIINNSSNNNEYLLKRPYWESHSKALYNETFYAERYQAVVVDAFSEET